MDLGKSSNHEKCDPEGQAVLKRLRQLDRQLAAEVDWKTVKLIRLRAATAKAKRLALAQEAEQRRHSGPGGDA
jgi:phosphoribosylformylglycinamidine (FGAM) synthase PurS component